MAKVISYESSHIFLTLQIIVKQFLFHYYKSNESKIKYGKKHSGKISGKKSHLFWHVSGENQQNWHFFGLGVTWCLESNNQCEMWSFSLLLTFPAIDAHVHYQIIEDFFVGAFTIQELWIWHAFISSGCHINSMDIWNCILIQNGANVCVNIFSQDLYPSQLQTMTSKAPPGTNTKP